MAAIERAHLDLSEEVSVKQRRLNSLLALTPKGGLLLLAGGSYLFSVAMPLLSSSQADMIGRGSGDFGLKATMSCSNACLLDKQVY